VESSVALAGRFVETDSPSIVISVSESTVTKTPPAIGTAPPPLQAVSFPDTPTASLEGLILPESPAAAQLRINSSDVEPVSPAVRYVALRERNRRNQLVFAVMLLMAVIVLAGVLIFVLQRGAGSAPARKSEPVSIGGVAMPRHAAVPSYHCFNALSALALNS
jgi:hypothetical protein